MFFKFFNSHQDKEDTVKQIKKENYKHIQKFNTKSKAKYLDKHTKYIEQIPDSLNSFIKLTYELINDPYSEGVCNNYILYSIVDTLNIYNTYNSLDIYDIYDVGYMELTDNKIKVLVCNLNNGLFYYRVDDKFTINIKDLHNSRQNKLITYQDWFYQL